MINSKLNVCVCCLHGAVLRSEFASLIDGLFVGEMKMLHQLLATHEL